MSSHTVASEAMLGHEHLIEGISFRKKLILLFFIILVSISLDQGTKIWAQASLTLKRTFTEKLDDGSRVQKTHFYSDRTKEVTVIPKAFNLIYKENPAAAFSLTSSLPDWFRRPFLVLFSLIAMVIFLGWYFYLKEKDWLLLIAFCLIIAGAMGNFLDRLRLGYVIDFLDMHATFLGYNKHWPTFNIADSCIVAGAIGVVIRSIWPYKAGQKGT